MDFSLDRIKAVLTSFNNPQDKYPIIHVAGTNGKGSVTSYINSILMNCTLSTIPLKIGKFNSPYLIEVEDSITIDNIPISTLDYIKLKELIIKTSKEKRLFLTEFEITTSIMFIYFQQEEVNLGIIEVGLGGKLDATNIIDKPLVCVITPVAIDHETFLGTTISEIAKHKAGIIKEGTKLVICQQTLEAIKVLEQTAISLNCDYVISKVAKYKDKLDLTNLPPKPRLVTYKSKRNINYEFQLNMSGEYQLINLAASIETIELLKSITKFDISQNSIELGITNTIWPGRLQWLSPIDHPRMLVDGAHNPAAAKELANYVLNLIDGSHIQTINWVIGFTKGKDVKEILDILLSIDVKKVTHNLLTVPFTQPDGMPWIEATPTEHIISIGKSLSNESSAYGSISDAFIGLKSKYPDVSTDSKTLVIVTGSLYLVADLFRYLNPKPTK